MKSQRLLTQYLIACILLHAALVLPSGQAKATTCTWQGGNGDWATPTNWSCGRVPLIEDDVVIDSVGMGPQLIYPSTILAGGNSISIGSDSILTVNGGDYGITITTNSNFTNEGEIIITGWLSINSPAFSNSGIVTINSGGLNLQRGGTHSGDFVGAERTYLGIGGDSYPGQTFIFTDTSQIQVPIILVIDSVVVNIAGDFTPGMVSLTPYESYLDIKSGTTFNLTTTSVFMPYKVSFTSATLNLPDTPLDIFELVGMGTLYNPAHLKIIEKLELTLYTLTGSGDIEVDSSASTFQLGGGTISGKTIYNPITAKWVSGNITLADGAVFQNSGTFNAKNAASVTNNAMNGGVNERFVNTGNFIKDTAGTTTTMDIPFTNDGTVDVIAGSLIFQQGMDNGEDVVIDLGGGTLDPGETLNLESGDSLIGSGTLAATLVSSGTVSPGDSPGNITVQGDYTQQSAGVLEIQLGGTTAGTEYDQLTVTGTATMAGTLNVSMIDGFIPQVGDSFTVLPYGSRSGGFNALNLPDGYRWGIDYGYPGLTLSVLEGGSISGTVSCSSLHTVFVDLWVDDYTSPPPEDSTTIACGESYSFTNLPDGTYYVGAWIDLNESGDGPPDEGEPYAWHGDPTAVTIIDAENRENIEITIEGGNNYIFLPLILR